MSIKWRVVWSWSAIAAVLLAVLSSWAFPGIGLAACTNDPGAALSAANFIGTPSSLLNGPNGPRTSAEISAEVRDFVAADPKRWPRSSPC